jgi:hypothetical protein
MTKSKTSEDFAGGGASRRTLLSGLMFTAAAPALPAPSLPMQARSPIWSRVERLQRSLDLPGNRIDEINAAMRGMLMPVATEDDLAAKRALLALYEEVTACPDGMKRIRIEHDAIGLKEIAR